MPRFDPELWANMLELGGIYIQRGINNFADWSAKMTQDVGKESEPWNSAIWETLKSIPEGSKFDEEQIMTTARYIGWLKCEGKIETLEDAQKEFEQYFDKETMKQILPTIKASYAGIKRYFDDLERKASPALEKLRWKVEGKTLTVGGVREIKFYRYGDLPWVRSVDAIQEIVIEAGVEKISANAFSECTRLELLTIPASVKTIGDYAFTFCYCGNRAVNGGKNVIWSLDDGVLTFKKNPAAKFATDFSIGVVSWRAVEKNITGFKLEAGVVPKEKFFEWLAQRDNAAQISFA